MGSVPSEIPKTMKAGQWDPVSSRTKYPDVLRENEGAIQKLPSTI